LLEAAAGMTGLEPAKVPAEVGQAAAKKVRRFVGRGTDITKPNRKWWTRQEETVPTGTVARRSSRTSRIPCGEMANNPDEEAV